jgi:signal transduction histidine kinase
MIQKLLSTTAFRLSLLYALLFSLVATGALVLAYWSAAQEIRQQTDDRLQLETNVLLSSYYSGTFEDLMRMVEHRMHEDASRFFVYTLTHYKQEGNSVEDKSSKGLSGERTKKFSIPTFATLPLKDVTSSLINSQLGLETRVLITPLANNSQLLVGSDLGEQKQLLDHIGKVMVLAVLVTLFTAFTGGIFLGFRSLNRIESIRKQAQAIIDGDLSRRMPIRKALYGHKQEDEYDKLSHVINDMLDRLEQLIHTTQNTTNNLAHDLRNPLNRLRHRLEYLRGKTNTSEQTQELGHAIEDIDRLVATFNAILNIAQIEANVQRDHWENVDVNAMIEDLSEMYSIVAEEAKIQFKVEIEPHLQLNTERPLLAQAVTNLLDNAIKYTPAGGTIWLQSQQTDNQLIIRICDNGPGIPDADKQRIFEHLTRLDSARSQAGNGLGLSLVKAIMDLHKESQINIKDNNPGLIVELIFTLP